MSVALDEPTLIFKDNRYLFIKIKNADQAIWGITNYSMMKLKSNVRYFFNSFQAISRDRITTELVRAKLKEYHLEYDHLIEYLLRVT